jgi:hypothetical protein
MFCILEKDEKTHDYVQLVIAHLRQGRIDGLVELDNTLQNGEILHHLHLNRLPEDHGDEMLAWIENHAQGFRDYLNTIKVAALMWIWAEETKDLAWDDFCRLADRINSLKPCLDAIHQ